MDNIKKLSKKRPAYWLDDESHLFNYINRADIVHPKYYTFSPPVLTHPAFAHVRYGIDVRLMQDLAILRNAMIRERIHNHP